MYTHFHLFNVGTHVMGSHIHNQNTKIEDSNHHSNVNDKDGFGLARNVLDKLKIPTEIANEDSETNDEYGAKGFQIVEPSQYLKITSEHKFANLNQRMKNLMIAFALLVVLIGRVRKL